MFRHGCRARSASKGLVFAKRNAPGRYLLVALIESMEATHTGSAPLMLPASRPLGPPDMSGSGRQCMAPPPLLLPPPLCLSTFVKCVQCLAQSTLQKERGRGEGGRRGGRGHFRWFCLLSAEFQKNEDDSIVLREGTGKWAKTPMRSFVPKRHGRGATEASQAEATFMASVRKRILCAEPSSRRIVESVHRTLAKG